MIGQQEKTVQYESCNTETAVHFQFKETTIRVTINKIKEERDGWSRIHPVSK